LSYTWSEKLVEWLTSPMVRTILLIVMLLAAYVELNTPGVGLPGLVAVCCLVVFLGAPYLTGLADMWDILAVVAGAVLLAVEVFVIPGFGVTGIAGIALICIGVVASFVGPEMPNQPPFYWPRLDYTLEALKTGVWALVIGLSAALAGGIALRRIFPSVPYIGQIVAPNPTAAAVAMPDPYPTDVARPGDAGVAETPLRPAGKARFEAVLFDVTTEGEFIELGARVEVLERRGNRVVVRRARK
jgi:membrane-bound serine protease (ClpP class)